MPFSTAFVGFVEGEPVVHLGMSGFVAGRERVARACRMVVMPEWQGAGIGMRFLNHICEREWKGEGFIGERVGTVFHTAHPGLVAGLKRDSHWRQVSAHLGGAAQKPNKRGLSGGAKGWGEHFRAVGGFRYWGDAK